MNKSSIKEVMFKLLLSIFITASAMLILHLFNNMNLISYITAICVSNLVNLIFAKEIFNTAMYILEIRKDKK